MSLFCRHDDTVLSEHVLKNPAAESALRRLTSGGQETLRQLTDATKERLAVTVKCKLCGRVAILESA